MTLAVVPLNFTAEPGLNPTLLIVTDVPTAALVGLRPVIESVGVKLVLLVAVPAAVVTESLPVTAPLGATAFSSVLDTNVTFGEAFEPNLTFAPGTKFLPVIVTVVPVIPEVGVNDDTVGSP